MKALGVMVLSFVTSVLSAGGAVYAIEHYSLIPKRPAEVPRAEVPKLVGLAEADARGNLATRGLVMLVGERRPTAAGEPGSVLEQSVEAGEQLARGDAVEVTLAAALPKVPSVVSISVEEAAQRLSQAGYKMEVGSGVLRDKVPEGLLAEQSPAAGTPLEKDSVVTVRAAAAPKPVEVPKVVGVTLDMAKKKVQDAGLAPTVSWVSVPSKQAFIVMRQDPLGGKELMPGEAVKLYANR
jgi:serine/threonine-protein kinase